MLLEARGSEEIGAYQRGLICSAQRGRPRVYGAREGRGLAPAKRRCCYPPKDGETDEFPVAISRPLRQALIDENAGHVNIVVSEADIAN